MKRKREALQSPPQREAFAQMCGSRHALVVAIVAYANTVPREPGESLAQVIRKTAAAVSAEILQEIGELGSGACRSVP